jgi:hypothetical protein
MDGKLITNAINAISHDIFTYVNLQYYRENPKLLLDKAKEVVMKHKDEPTSLCYKKCGTNTIAVIYTTKDTGKEVVLLTVTVAKHLSMNLIDNLVLFSTHGITKSLIFHCEKDSRRNTITDKFIVRYKHLGCNRAIIGKNIQFISMIIERGKNSLPMISSQKGIEEFNVKCDKFIEKGFDNDQATFDNLSKLSLELTESRSLNVERLKYD